MSSRWLLEAMVFLLFLSLKWKIIVTFWSKKVTRTNKLKKKNSTDKDQKTILKNFSARLLFKKERKKKKSRCFST